MSNIPSFDELQILVRHWGTERGIVANGKPLGQARKTLEEAGELVEALSVLAMIKDYGLTDVVGMSEIVAHYTNKAADAVGDVLVTLEMVCATSGLEMRECFALAYDEIKDRKGYLTPEGVFVKEQS